MDNVTIDDVTNERREESESSEESMSLQSYKPEPTGSTEEAIQTMVKNE